MGRVSPIRGYLGTSTQHIRSQTTRRILSTNWCGFQPVMLFFSNRRPHPHHTMSSQDTLRILVLGHSFVWRLAQFAAEAKMSCISSDFHLTGPSSVQFYGIGGRTLTKLHQFDLSLVAQFNPTILLLEIGSNDLGNPKLEATDLTTNIFRLAQQLHFSYWVSHNCKSNFTAVFATTNFSPI